MPFEFIQIPANGQGSAKEELNKLLRGGRIASVRKEFVAHGEDSFWAFCIEFLDGSLAAGKGRGGPPGAGSPADAGSNSPGGHHPGPDQHPPNH